MARPSNLRLVTTALIALVLASIALINLLRTGEDIVRTRMDSRGVPIEVFAPAHPTQDRVPAVVVAHGFSGSRQLMYGFGYTLAKNGYVAALIEFAGHGVNTTPLAQNNQGSQSLGQLADNLSVALDAVRQLPSVDSERVAILGHSMGAGVVTQYAVEYAEVPATIAVSLGGFGAMLPPKADVPRNLLILVGQNEFEGFTSGSLAALRAAYPEGATDNIYGDPSIGTARRLVNVPVVEHISILFSQVTYRKTVRWLDAVFSPEMITRQPVTDSRIGWVGLLFLAALMGFYPLSAALLRNKQSGSTPLVPTRPILIIAVSLIAAVLSPVLLLVIPINWVPLTVGNYVAAYFLISGLMLCVGGWLTRRRWLLALTGWRQLALPVFALSAYALLTLGVPAHLALVNFELSGIRIVIMPVVTLCLFVFFTADEALIARPSSAQRIILYSISRLFVLVSLVVAIFVLRAPFFLALLVPVFVLLFIWHGFYAHWLQQRVYAPWIAGWVNALVYAWFVSAVFPVVG